jgi:hypothetical protein
MSKNLEFNAAFNSSAKVEKGLPKESYNPTYFMIM